MSEYGPSPGPGREWAASWCVRACVAVRVCARACVYKYVCWSMGFSPAQCGSRPWAGEEGSKR